MFTLHFVGYHFLEPNSSINISEADLNATNTPKDDSKLHWIFNTTLGFRIMFKFHRFSLFWSSNYYSALEIGDGIEIRPGTRLAHFRGLDVPDDVVSVSNAAWITIYEMGPAVYTSTRLTICHPKPGR